MRSCTAIGSRRDRRPAATGPGRAARAQGHRADQVRRRRHVRAAPARAPRPGDRAARDPGHGQSRTLLHVVTDWPGRVPEAAAKIAALAAAGADVNARFTGPHSETPLHWAASSDDVEALDALLDAGADIEADGAVIGGGTPMADAVGLRPVEGRATTARTRRAHQPLAGRRARAGRPCPRRARGRAHAQGDLDNALWCAAHGGQRGPPSCCSTAAPTRPGSDTTGSRPHRPPNAATRTSSPPGYASRIEVRTPHTPAGP